MSSLTPEQVRDRVATLTVWRRGSQRAPHKPLLLLYALARFAEGRERMRYSEVEPQLRRLLDAFGPPRKSHHPNYPFWRLQNDDLWVLDGADSLRKRASNTDPLVSALRKYNPAGRLPDDVAATLRAHPGLIGDLAQDVLAAHFPGTMRDEILDAVGWSGPLPDDHAPFSTRWRSKRTRDPAFRRTVLDVYDYRCAVCGFDAQVGPSRGVGVEAAHVKWHQAGGPDTVRNGLALCALHHRLLDGGVWTPSPAGIVLVAASARGGETFDRWVAGYHGRPLRQPVSSQQRVAEPHLAWHVKEVFRGPARS